MSAYPTPDEITAQVQARSGHTCAVCPAPIRRGFLMCSKHWRLVPRPTQQEVYRTWGRMQRSHPRSGFGASTRGEYFRARDAAIACARATQSTTDGEAP